MVKSCENSMGFLERNLLQRNRSSILIRNWLSSPTPRIFSDSERQNPFFARSTRVFVPYCSWASQHWRTSP